jgi:ribosome production factor 1
LLPNDLAAMTKIRDDRPANAMKRSSLHQQRVKDKGRAKLLKRLARKKEETANPALKAERLAQNVPRTIENTKVFIGEETQDKRLMPVQFKDVDNMELDMGGLEDLFGAGEDSDEPRRILLTTTPKPDKGIHSFLKELKSLFGGDANVDLRVRKNQRFELSKVCRWAAKRQYKALVVVGDLHHDTSKLPSLPTSLL